MPVPESYASRRYAGREETFSTYSQTRSATRPGLITSAFNSKLTSSTLPPRPSFERKLSIESASSSSRYSSGSRTIPSYTTPSINRSSASPARATTSVLRQELPSVAERYKYEPSSSTSKEFVSRFLRPRDSSVGSSSLGTKSNAYLTTRERSCSRDSGYVSPSIVGTTAAFSGIGGRDRNVRGNIAARAASIGPSVLSRPLRNGHSTLSQQSSTEVTSKSNVSSTVSSTNVSRGATPPKRNQTTPSISNATSSQAKGANEKCASVGTNRNDGITLPIPSKNPVPGNDPETLTNGDIDKGQGVNENESKKREQCIKMVTEVDSNGNALINDFNSEDEQPQNVVGVMGTKKLARQETISQKRADISGENEVVEKCRSNSSNLTCIGVESQVESAGLSENHTTPSSIMTKSVKRRNSSGIAVSISSRGVQPSKLISASDIKPLKEAELTEKKTLPVFKYAVRQQSASPVRQFEQSYKLRTPSPVKLASAIKSRSRETTSSISINRKISDGNSVIWSDSTATPSTSTGVGQGSVKIQTVPAASREPSLSRSPSPELPLVPKAPPLPDLYLNGKIGPDDMPGRKENNKSQNERAGPSHQTTMQSDSSDNDGDNYTSSPTLGGRFRPTRDKNTDYEKEAGLSGLRNIGNTCFMNSVLQCLSNTKPLLEYIVRKHYSDDINTSTSGMKGALMRAFADLCHELWRDTKSTVDTSAFKDQVQKFAPRFMGYSQQDAQEFLRYLLEGLHEDINRVDKKPSPLLTEIDDSLSDSNKAAQSWKRYLRSDDSKIVDLFVGQLKSTLKCTTCGHCSVTFDPFWDLSLPIPSKTGQVRLSQCLELFTKEEVLDGDEKPTCSKCTTRRKCTKSFSIQKFPQILVIHLKRFSPTERYRGKLSTTVDFPLMGLDMTPYAASRSTGCVYNLYGVANHSGSTYSGHYVAYCKHPYIGDWHCYNDSRVSPISSQSVVSSDGYLLFYELANSSSD